MGKLEDSQNTEVALNMISGNSTDKKKTEHNLVSKFDPSEAFLLQGRVYGAFGFAAAFNYYVQEQRASAFYKPDHNLTRAYGPHVAHEPSPEVTFTGNHGTVCQCFTYDYLDGDEDNLTEELEDFLVCNVVNSGHFVFDERKLLVEHETGDLVSEAYFAFANNLVFKSSVNFFFDGYRDLYIEGYNYGKSITDDWILAHGSDFRTTRRGRSDNLVTPGVDRVLRGRGMTGSPILAVDFDGVCMYNSAVYHFRNKVFDDERSNNPDGDSTPLS